VDRLYNEAVARGDDQFNRENYAEAKESYNVAAGYKANEPYPKERLKDVEAKLLEEEAKRKADVAQKAKQQEYEQLLKLGGEHIATREYQLAKQNFTDAQSLFPEAEIPTRKLELIEELLERERQAKVYEQYKDLVNKADRAFIDTRYDEAVALYQEAKIVKSDENYPSERINKINEILTEKANKAKQADEDSRKRVVEETYDEGRTKVTIRKVTVDGKTDIYKRVIHSWGGKYYFLNDQPITELVWSRETAK
jgi:DICT domain-containing protein